MSSPTVAKPKVDGGKKNRRRYGNSEGTSRKEFTTKVVGIEEHTFDIGSPKYAAKFQKSLESIALHVQHQKPAYG